jgi:preprotein translocase subunit SecG
MIQTLILICHLLLAMAIIGLVLLQRGKGAEAGTGFGAGASGTVFGARGSASFFSRATAVLATLFFATSLALAYFATQTTSTDVLVGEGASAAPGAGQGEIDDLPDVELPESAPGEPVAQPADADPADAAGDSAGAASEPAEAAGGESAADE